MSQPVWSSVNKINKPIVAVTGPNSGGFFAWLFSALQVLLAGGRPVRIYPKKYQNQHDKKIIDFDALIIGGGTDIHPDTRGSEVVDQTYKKNLWSRVKEFLLFPYEGFSKIFKSEGYDPERDKMERAYYLYAKFSGKPVLGICRGHQLVNVIEGAVLIEDTDSIYQEEARIRTVFPRKKIKIYSDSKILKKIIGKSTANVNAIHSQAISKPGKYFDTVAVEENGIVQATEWPSKKVLTVQWHPEYLIYEASQRKLFQWLVESAKQNNITEYYEEPRQEVSI